MNCAAGSPCAVVLIAPRARGDVRGHFLKVLLGVTPIRSDRAARAGPPRADGLP